MRLKSGLRGGRSAAKSGILPALWPCRVPGSRAAVGAAEGLGTAARGEGGRLERAATHGSTVSRQVLPEPCFNASPFLAKGRREGRAPAAPEIRALQGMHTVWTTGDAGRPAFPARMVLTVSFVLSPGSDALLPPSSRGSLMRAPGRAATSPRALTHRPRASGPHDFSVRGRPRPIIRGLRVLTQDDRRARCTSAVSYRVAWMPHGCPPCHHADRADAAASTATRPACRDGRERPLWQGRDEACMP
ncbi:hypothetical protein SAMN04487925_1011030 [Bradyrhizobium sp. cf659]|nr:hypothetical protein SAMN04487925_1011030 [Bradyrhizobium sp. cf659]